ncbi:MAG TPA: hypothetical protein VNN20_06690 [Thermodesulfobacteriota bacterium]|nr:hypothetical protein [Thermodesulfobacteriota bacterium]
MIEPVLDAVIQSVTTLILGKVISGASTNKIKKRNRLITPESTKFQEKDISLGGDLGQGLLSAYKRFVETKDPLAVEEYLKMAGSDREIIFVVELSRTAEDDVRIQFGKSVEYVVSSVREIDPAEFPGIAVRIADFLKTVNTVHKGPKIHLVLSMPVVLAFQIGQWVGISHYDIEPYHFERGRYLRIPSIKRG